MTATERAGTHKWAKENGLKSHSDGPKKGLRRLILTKPKKVPKKGPGEELKAPSKWTSRKPRTRYKR